VRFLLRHADGLGILPGQRHLMAEAIELTLRQLGEQRRVQRLARRRALGAAPDRLEHRRIQQLKQLLKVGRSDLILVRL